MNNEAPMKMKMLMTIANYHAWKSIDFRSAESVNGKIWLGDAH